MDKDMKTKRSLEARMLMAEYDPPCIWFRINRCNECCVLCVSFDMCIKRWTAREHSFYCPLLFRIHYCSAIINWYKKREREREKEKQRK